MTGPLSDRASHMLRRVERDWRDAGLDAGAMDVLVESATRVMRLRTAAFASDHHPAFLHPLRGCLLMLEAGIVTPRALALVLALDSEAPEREGAVTLPVRSLPTEVADTVLRSTPDDRRLEWLVTAEPDVLATYLSERLDHLRHLHLWAGPERTAAALERARHEELPLAARVGGRLDRAWRDWLDKAERFGLAARARMWPVVQENAADDDR